MTGPVLTSQCHIRITTSGGKPARLEPGRRALRPAQAWRRAKAPAEQLRHEQDLIGFLEDRLDFETGQSRQLTITQWIAVMALGPLLGYNGTIAGRVEAVMDLPPKTRLYEGLTDSDGHTVSYKQVWRLYDRVVELLEREPDHDHPVADPETGEILECPPDCPAAAAHDWNWFYNRVVAASVRIGGAPVFDWGCLDSTDYETHARRRSHKRDQDVTVGNLIPDDATTDYKKSANEPGWPRTMADGRAQHTLDPDAGEGYRSGKNHTPGYPFCGYDHHLITTGRPLGHPDQVCVQVLGGCVASAGSNKGVAGRRAEQETIASGFELNHFAYDRGYSYLEGFND